MDPAGWPGRTPAHTSPGSLGPLERSNGSDMGAARGRVFVTDNVRGVAGQDLTARLAMDLSVSAAAVLGQASARAGSNGADGLSRRDRHAVAVVGRDPRASGEFLEAAVVAGLASSGV